jgi:hypothetical protein
MDHEWWFSLSLSLSLSKGSRVPHQAGWGRILMKQIVKTEREREREREVFARVCEESINVVYQSKKKEHTYFQV